MVLTPEGYAESWPRLTSLGGEIHAFINYEDKYVTFPNGATVKFMLRDELLTLEGTTCDAMYFYEAGKIV